MQDTKTMCHADVDSVREIGCAYRVNVCGSVWQWLQGLAPSLVHRTESAASLVESRRVSLYTSRIVPRCPGAGLQHPQLHP